MIKAINEDIRILRVERKRIAESKIYANKYLNLDYKERNKQTKENITKPIDRINKRIKELIAIKSKYYNVEVKGINKELFGFVKQY